MGEGGGVGDRAVPRSAPRQLRRSVEGCTAHEAVDALVHIAQSLLQTHHGLTVAAKAEVAGLDDAGVHWAHWDLIERWAGRRTKGIGVALCRRCRLRRTEGVAHPPAPVVEPGALVGRVLRLKAVEVADRTLKAQGWRVCD